MSQVRSCTPPIATSKPKEMDSPPARDSFLERMMAQKQAQKSVELLAPELLAIKLKPKFFKPPRRNELIFTMDLPEEPTNGKSAKK